MNSRLGRDRAVIIWLLAVCLTILIMVVVGGITRLTESGLSMVEWQPIMGAVPPTNTEEWQDAFELYKQYPQYQKVNGHISLEDFKSIFYWEYGHRVLGRLIGLMFFLPFLVFYFQGRFDGSMKAKMTFAFCVGGLQGLMGWYMVKSGLVDMPRVSHLRLAAHLSLALFLLGYLFWVVLQLFSKHGILPRSHKTPLILSRITWLLFILVTIQIIYGAFTAGLRAGYGYNTFPLMNEQWIADAVGILVPWWLNLLESGATVQFIHRYLGIILLVAVCLSWLYGRTCELNRSQLVGLDVLLAVTLGQFILGVTTLLYVVPISLASLHQAGACLLLLSVIYNAFTLTGGGAGLPGQSGLSASVANQVKGNS
jgi:cytochrome c oxidase assembly protein subunit 15